MTNEQAQSHERAEGQTTAANMNQEGAATPSRELEASLEDARAKAEDHWNQLLRARAELENMRRRAERDVENAHKYALERFVQELLPVKDSMELGMAAMDARTPEVQKLREGTELTLKMLGQVLEKFAVKEVNPVGERFNPEHHLAMSTQETADLEPNRVVAVVQKGYTLNERLIRPAMVIVSKAVTPPQESKVDEMA